MERNIFELATKNKVRFNFKGIITTEDLWDLSITNLNKIYADLRSQEKDKVEFSLIETKSKADEELQLKIEIVTYIFKSKVEEQERTKNEKAKKDEKQKLLQLLAEKEDESLKNMSKEEIEKKLAELN